MRKYNTIIKEFESPAQFFLKRLIKLRMKVILILKDEWKHIVDIRYYIMKILFIIKNY